MDNIFHLTHISRQKNAWTSYDCIYGVSTDHPWQLADAIPNCVLFSEHTLLPCMLSATTSVAYISHISCTFWSWCKPTSIGGGQSVDEHGGPNVDEQIFHHWREYSVYYWRTAASIAHKCLHVTIIEKMRYYKTQLRLLCGISAMP